MLIGSAAPALRSQSASVRVAVSSAQRPSWTIRPDSSATGMNSPGAIDRPSSSVPARQRLEAGDAAGLEVDQRLVGEREAVGLDRDSAVRFRC